MESTTSDASSPDDRERSARKSMGAGWSRRGALAAGASAVAGLVASSVVGRVRGADEAHVVLDVVDDLGADDTGRDPINVELEDAISRYDSLEIRFPDGEYAIDGGDRGIATAPLYGGTLDTGPRTQTIALVGDGWPTLRPVGTGAGDRGHPLFTLGCENIRLERFVIDQTGRTVSSGITAVAEETLQIRDIHVAGTAGREDAADVARDAHPTTREPPCLTCAVTDRDGKGEIANVLAPDGAAERTRKSGACVHPSHAGELRFTECEFSRFTDAGLELTAAGSAITSGSIHVENSLFRDNDRSAIQIGRPMEEATSTPGPTEPDTFAGWSGKPVTSRVGNSHLQEPGARITGPATDHEVVDHPYSQERPQLTVKDAQFELPGDDAYAIRATQPAVEGVGVRNIVVEGAATPHYAIESGGADLAITNLRLASAGGDRTDRDQFWRSTS